MREREMTGNGKGSCILVTGGAGYIGCQLVPMLSRAGYQVRVFDVMFYGDAGLSSVRNEIEVVEGDIRRVPVDLFEGVSAIINLAGLSTEPAAEYCPEANQEINFKAAVELASMAKKMGVRRFIQASSGSIYDVGAGHPEKDILHTEDFPVQPFRTYSITKREAEKKILALADQSFTAVILRKGSVYGYSPRMRFDLVVNAFTLSALQTGRLALHNGGEMWRPLLSIQDAVAAYELMLEVSAEKINGEIFNVTNGNYRISELALRVQNKLLEMDIRSEIRPDYNYRNLRSCQASGEKIRQRLGFTPKVSVEQTVEDLVQKIRDSAFRDPNEPEFHNIRWLDLLEETRASLGWTESVFNLNPEQLRELRAAACKQRSAVACE
jgi:nucleoside-diphosphate-sugar epimerase